MMNLYLTNLIDVNVLQQIQDGFSAYTGMAALTTDADGIPVTKGSGFTRFCTDLTRRSVLGEKRCAECDKQGALQTLIQEKPAVYHCHAGLVDYAAPIMVENKFIGSFIGGQVRTSELDEQEMYKKAIELGIDPRIYIEAANETVMLSEHEVQKAAQFLSEIAKILSEMAYKNYVSLQKSIKMEKASKSQSDFIMNINLDIQENVKKWINIANTALEKNNYSALKGAVNDILYKSKEMLSTSEDTVEYIKMSDGTIELTETEYKIRDVVKQILDNIKSTHTNTNVKLSYDIASSVPEYLLGDSGRVGQIINKLVLNGIRFTEKGEVSVSISCNKVSYATILTISIKDTGVGMTQEQLENMLTRINSEEAYPSDTTENPNLGFYVIGLMVRQMSGAIQVESKLNEGSIITVNLPQLAISEVNSNGI